VYFSVVGILPKRVVAPLGRDTAFDFGALKRDQVLT
jgi:hypothetical protein